MTSSQPGPEQPGFAAIPQQPNAPTAKKKQSNGMLTMRIIGWLMFAYGAAMLIMLFTPMKQWALEHSIAALVSAGDRRVGNTIQGAVDEPIAIAGSVVVMFAGLWFALLVPWIIERSKGKQMELIEQMQRERGADGSGQ